MSSRETRRPERRVSAGSSGGKNGLLVPRSKTLEELDHVQSHEMRITSRERSDSLAQEIVAYFQSAVETGRLKRGDRLPTQRKLAEQFGVAMSTVRKALATLSENGVVIQRPGSGTYVTADSALGSGLPSDVRAVQIGPQDVLEACATMEPTFADFVVSRATQENFALVENWLIKAERATDVTQFRNAMYRFHMEIAKATRNTLLIRLFEIIMDARERVGWHALRVGDETESERAAIAASCREILEALRNRDAKTARGLLRTLLSR